MTNSFSPAMFHILLALADQPRHGYGIMQEVEQFTEGRLKLGPGTLYRSVKHLLAVNLIKAMEGNSASAPHEEQRHYYVITELGRQALRTELQHMDMLLKAAQRKGAFKTIFPSQAAEH